MKIQIIQNVSDCIDGYNPVFLEDDTINLDVPDNSINSILVLNSIEQISYINLDKFLQKLKQLLRLNGNIVLSGIDINCLCRDLINQNIDPSTYNDVVYNRKGIYDCKELSNKLNSIGIMTEKLLLKGSTYELHAVRNN